MALSRLVHIAADVRAIAPDNPPSVNTFIIRKPPSITISPAIGVSGSVA
jgi:hypothetical protein